MLPLTCGRLASRGATPIVNFAGVPEPDANFGGVPQPDRAPARAPYVKAPKSAPREVPVEEFEIGAFVEVTGLQKAPQLNKEVGRLRSYSAQTGRWLVAFSNADLGSKAILPHNLLRVVTEHD